MESITREFLTQRRLNLERQYQEALATLKAVDGALQENAFLEKQLSEKTPPAPEPPVAPV